MKYIFYLFIVLFLGGCSSEYSAERLLWEANQLKKTIAQSPEGSPPGLYKKAREAFQEVVQEYPETKSALVASLSIGELYALEGELNKAAECFEQVSKKSESVDKEFSAKTMIALAKIEEQKGNWNQANSIYQNALEKYKGAYSVLGIPIYIARYLKSRNMMEDAEKQYQTAVAYYEGIEKEQPDSKISLLAYDFHLNCYIDRKMWQETLEILKTIQDNYPGTQEAAAAKVLDMQVKKVIESEKS